MITASRTGSRIASQSRLFRPLTYTRSPCTLAATLDKYFMRCNISSMKDRTILLERLMAAQTMLRRRFIEVTSPTLQSEFAELGGTTFHQMEVIRRLLLGDGMSMREVAEAQGIGLSGATQLIDRLERRGLVTRVRDARDRRVQHVVPTERAKELAAHFKAGMRRASAEVFTALDDDELRAYVDLTERVAATVRDDEEHLRRATA
jgi:DNA-binding MarR family transcriptional regulator